MRFDVEHFVSDNYAAGRLDPAAAVVQAIARADGLDDAGRSGSRVSGAFDDAMQRAAHGLIAGLLETHGDGVAADGVGGGKIEFIGDVHERNPVHEELLNGSAILVLADGAFAGVTLCFGEERIGILGAARAVARS